MKVVVHSEQLYEVKENELCVSFFKVDDTYSSLADFDILDDVEKNQAHKMRTSHLRNKYINTHSLVRKELAKIINEPPSKIIIQKTKYGKPFIPKNKNLFFNYSHSENFLMLGVSLSGEVGVDIEAQAEDLSLLQLAETQFLKSEVAFIKSQCTQESLSRFFKFWTAKEAFIKGDGRGLSLGLKSSEFALEEAHKSIQLVKGSENCVFFDLNSYSHKLSCPQNKTYFSAATVFQI